MRRLSAIWRCLFYGFLPTWVERPWKGRVHYQQYSDGTTKEPEYWISWWTHCKNNLGSAWQLVTFTEPEEDREFHGLD